MERYAAIRRAAGRLIGLALIAGLLAGPASAADWPAWDNFKSHLISAEGRVIDRADPRRITTSEGQSYALFFALVANDRETFQRLLDWTQRHLAQGDLGAVLPAWLWGRDADGAWRVLDANSAADSDLWIAYTLLEAGRLWQRRDYRVLGWRLAGRIAEREVVTLSEAGPLLLPGPQGFVAAPYWRVNPSYLPPPLLTRLAALGEPWTALAATAPTLLRATAPQGLAPDWAAWQQGRGWVADPVQGSAGDYDAIRVYLWLGLMAEADPARARLLAHFAPMRAAVAELGVPPERVDAASGDYQGRGNAGFSAALLPFLAAAPGAADPLATAQRRRLAAQPPAPDAYYSQALALFGQGWDAGRYRFDAAGQLRPAWQEAP